MLSTSSFEQAVGYEEDFALWAELQADRLMKRNFAALDIVNLAEELRIMGRSEHKALSHRLTVLLAHLLKCQVQPDHKSAHWRATLLEQRERIATLLADSPSLKPHMERQVAQNYARAVRRAAADTHLPQSRFPAENPFTVEQVLDQDYEP